MNQSMNPTLCIQRQNNNRQLQRPQNIANLQGVLNAGRQVPGHQNIPNFFIDTYTPAQQYSDLVGGSNPFVRMQN
ncbi:2232_t:CDS:1, partial [Gigaspora margarita]